MARQWRKMACGLALLLLPCFSPGTASADESQSVLTYHNHADRSGNFVVPALTWQRAAALRPDTGFDAKFSGQVYAQPLYWQAPGARSGMLLVATEENNVHAFDGSTGRELWRRALGPPVDRSMLPCGDIDPLGVTGTPVIDARRGTLYLNAMIADPGGPRHRIFALSLADGAVLPGWPVDVAAALKAAGQQFTGREQNQRSALITLNDTLYVAYSGHFGDCGGYHGWVVGVALSDPRKMTYWRTRGVGGGIWAPGGISSDGRDLFVSTGNTLGVSSWSDGEAVFRLTPDLRRSARAQDFFALADWREADGRDADLGGTNPLPIDVPMAQGSQALLLALGKDRRAYLLDRHNLGGIGGSLVAATVTSDTIRTAPAAYPAGDGVFVAFQGAGTACPQRRVDNGLTVLKIHAGSPPSMTTAWCGALRGRGAPMVTTTDGHSNPIVWILGAEGDNRLHGFKGDTGEVLFDGGESAMRGLHRFQTLVATQDRLYVAADGRVYAFAF